MLLVDLGFTEKGGWLNMWSEHLLHISLHHYISSGIQIRDLFHKLPRASLITEKVPYYNTYCLLNIILVHILSINKFVVHFSGFFFLFLPLWDITAEVRQEKEEEATVWYEAKGPGWIWIQAAAVKTDSFSAELLGHWFIFRVFCVFC